MYNEPLTFDVVPGKTADTRIFRLHGPITLANLFDFQKVLNAGTEKLTIIDFTESEYMDSAGLGALLNYYVSGKRHGRIHDPGRALERDRAGVAQGLRAEGRDEVAALVPEDRG